MTCRHCGSALPQGFVEYCCAGCESVATLLASEGLTRYYALAGGEVAPAMAVAARSLAWLEPLLARANAAPGELVVLDLDVQGVHCAACVWLFEQLFRRQPGGVAITVNAALGKLTLTVRRGFEVAGYLAQVERFGYQFGPSRKQAEKDASELPIRLGVCAALAMNVMLFSVSFYFGLAPTDGPVFLLFTRLSLALTSAVVLVGGWPFFRSALQGLRSGQLHLDLPIAVGLVLAFAASVVQAREGRGDHAYLDTLNVFVTLMVAGRWLQQRVLERNRRLLLEDDGADGLLVRRVRQGVLETIPAPKVEAGDELLLAPGDVAPVAGTLIGAPAEVSLAWVTGESRPLTRTGGQLLPAGAIVEGGASLRLRAEEDFSRSRLATLLRAPAPRQRPRDGLWPVVARLWVAAVFVLAGVALWRFWPQGPARALDVTVALLVVTCPCAIGIAVPLATDLALGRLRTLGFYARADVLDRLADVRQVLFDKTGTLTLGGLELESPAAALALEPEVREAAFNLAARSNHPVSRCITKSLAPHQRLEPDFEAREVPGCGVESVWKGRRLRLGRRDWACGDPGSSFSHPLAEPSSAAVLTVDGQLQASFPLRESLRRDAASEVQALERAGLAVWILSGDRRERVEALAATLGVRPERAHSALSPENKAAAVAAIDRRDTLYLGDGVNDRLAFERALCAGTPAVDRPVVSGGADFFLLGEGLAPIRASLAVARKLRAVVRLNLGLAVAYNLLAISVTLAGGMTPLRAAVSMPLSSLTLLTLTVAALRERRPKAAERMLQGRRA